MYVFFGKVARSRISYICNRHSKANNKYLKTYDQREELKHIIYLDANNLYCHTMPKFLPASRFKRIDPSEVDLNK